MQNHHISALFEILIGCENNYKQSNRLKALPHGREKPTSSTTRRRGMWIPTAKRCEVHVVIVKHDKHVLFSRQREVLPCMTCALSSDEIIAQAYVHCYHCIHFVTFLNNQGVIIIK